MWATGPGTIRSAMKLICALILPTRLKILLSPHTRSPIAFVRVALSVMISQREVIYVTYEIVRKMGKAYVAATAPLTCESDALDLMSGCYEGDTNLVMLMPGSLTQDFFRLRSGLAGAVLQKFANYSVVAAAVITQEIKGKFNEVLNESQKSSSFRAFSSVAAAEEWLLQQ
jgi:PadR family transcriptional regulator, regulatory protein AphA